MADSFVYRGQDKCQWCGEWFPTPPGGYGYGYKGKICCSYHCQRAMERADPNSYLSIKEKLQRAEAPWQQRYETKYVNKTPAHTHLTDGEIERCIELYRSGMIVTRIAQEMHRGVNTIAQILHDANVRKKYKRRNARITEAQRARMLEMRRWGLSIAQIAEALMVSTTSVARTVRGVRKEAVKEI